MRSLPAILTLCLLGAGFCQPAFGATARWMGTGKTAKASDRMNWSLGRLPAENDYVIFGALSSRDCSWDLELKLSSFSVTDNYRGDIRLQSSLKVAGNMNIEGGMLDLGEAALTVGRRLYIGRAGIFELSNGELRVGPEGVLVDAGGTFFSRGSAKARILPAEPGEYYGFIVGRGNISLSNSAGTDIEGSGGMTIYSLADVKQADFVNVKQIKPGAPALRLFRAEGQELKPKGWTLDGTVDKWIASPDAGLEKKELAAIALEAPAPATGALADYPTVTAQEAAVPAPLPAAAVAEEPQEAPFTGLEEYETAKAKTNVLPYLALQFSGGQHFFQQEKGNLSGNLDVLASVAVKHEKLGPKWTIVPVLSSQFQGTKQVTDLVGGGTLFQERMSHSLAVRGVYQLSPKWKFKPGFGYKWEFLKETRDETWGNGLFDYRRPGFSLEGEYAYKDPFTIRLGYDFYHIGFVNFTSLESIIKDSQGNSMARELAGSSVLDSYNHAFSFGGTIQGPWRSYAEGNLSTTVRLFPDQHVVAASGDFRNSTRRDYSSQLSLAWRAPREISGDWKAIGGLRLAAGYNKSNQNSYDAQRLKYLKDYYDSTSIRAGVDLSLSRKLAARKTGTNEERPLQFNLSATVGRISYLGRQAQDATGLYQGKTVYQNEAVLGLGVSYPVAPHFVWTAQFGYGRQSSNQNFERLYRYNFATTNYRIGFGYEY